ncbi:MAG: hypothetical protein M3017_15265 [Actinomycetota bacterium]|nr:hypothetical protein [Actinomycetota bacterium]
MADFVAMTAWQEGFAADVADEPGSLQEGKKEGVDNVNTVAPGSGRSGVELLRIRDVSGTAQCLQGLEAGSSPSSGTANPLETGDSCS